MFTFRPFTSRESASTESCDHELCCLDCECGGVAGQIREVMAVNQRSPSFAAVRRKHNTTAVRRPLSFVADSRPTERTDDRVRRRR